MDAADTNEMQARLMALEDDMRAEQALGFAARFILGNLFTHLERIGVMEGEPLIRLMQEGLPQLESPNEQIAARLLLDDLLAQSRATAALRNGPRH